METRPSVGERERVRLIVTVLRLAVFWLLGRELLCVLTSWYMALGRGVVMRVHLLVYGLRAGSYYARSFIGTWPSGWDYLCISPLGESCRGDRLTLSVVCNCSIIC